MHEKPLHEKPQPPPVLRVAFIPAALMQAVDAKTGFVMTTTSERALIHCIAEHDRYLLWKAAHGE